MATDTTTQTKLVDACGLLEALFNEQPPTKAQDLSGLQWEIISHLKLGHLVRFDIDQVKDHLGL